VKTKTIAKTESRRFVPAAFFLVSQQACEKVQKSLQKGLRRRKP
jgi:hypothetical protein